MGQIERSPLAPERDLGDEEHDPAAAYPTIEDELPGGWEFGTIRWAPMGPLTVRVTHRSGDWFAVAASSWAEIKQETFRRIGEINAET